MKVAIVVGAALCAAIVGALIGVQLAQSDKKPIPVTVIQPTQDIPWQCQSMKNFEEFGREHPNLMYWCTNNVGH